MRLRIATSQAEREMCFALRRTVFMAEQGVTEAEEWDGLEDDCHHILATDGDAPVGTARLRPMGDALKVQRVAVIAPYRGRGLGHRIMTFALERARETGCARVTLEAQTHAIPFYEALGFTAHGPEFDDAGIPHRHMRLELGHSTCADSAPRHTT